MTKLDRRSFINLSSWSLLTLTAARPVSVLASRVLNTTLQNSDPTAGTSCWLDVCAPFVIQDPTIGISSEIVLTSDSFIGVNGYSEGDVTEYEIYLFDAEGRQKGDGNVSSRLTVPAMHTTVLPIADIVGPAVSFWGGLTIRLRPKTKIACHATDLFSSAFVRWTSTGSFANVHANPDPIQWQQPHKFFYSMPFPTLSEYECLYSLFNPYRTESRGILTLYDRFGTTLRELPYTLPPRSSLLFDLRRGEYIKGLSEFFQRAESAHLGSKLEGGDQGGTLAVINEEGFVKNFGYMLINEARKNRFSIEHPIHQQTSKPATPTPPFDSAGRLKIKNILYTPLVFNSAKLGGVTLKSRFHLSSGAPVEEFLWLSPFVADSHGEVV